MYALGFPYSGVLSGSVNFTSGNISSLSGIRNDTRYLQFTPPVQPGNSGGPLVDGEGHVLGVVTGRLADIEVLKASGPLPQNVNFAIRGELAKSVLKANNVEPKVAQGGHDLLTRTLRFMKAQGGHVLLMHIATSNYHTLKILFPLIGGLTILSTHWKN